MENRRSSQLAGCKGVFPVQSVVRSSMGTHQIWERLQRGVEKIIARMRGLVLKNGGVVADGNTPGLYSI